ncbi:MAG TPA: CHASE3 domain-containing protein, partial [Cyanophyceae cyanobacterium]
MLSPLMKWSLQGQWIAGGFGLTLLLMGFVSLASYKNTTEIAESADRVQHTYELLNTLTDFYASMTVAESGRRGYIFSGSQQELQRHLTAIKDMQSKLKTLQQQMSQNPGEQKRLAKLNTLVAQRLALFQESIILYQNDQSAIPAQADITERSITIRSEIQNVLGDIKTEEERLLRRWIDQSRSSIHYRIAIELFITLLSFLVILGIYFLLYYQWLQRRKVETLQQNLAQ